jgi:hypothetical protein
MRHILLWIAPIVNPRSCRKWVQPISCPENSELQKSSRIISAYFGGKGRRCSRRILQTSLPYRTVDLSEGLCDRKLSLLISRRPSASARPPGKKPMAATNSSVNSWLRWPTKALPCQTQSQLGCGSWYFRFVQYVSTLGLCGFLTYLFKLRLVGQSSSTCLFDSYGGIPYPTGLSKVNPRLGMRYAIVQNGIATGRK